MKSNMSESESAKAFKKTISDNKGRTVWVIGKSAATMRRKCVSVLISLTQTDSKE